MNLRSAGNVVNDTFMGLPLVASAPHTCCSEGGDPEPITDRAAAHWRLMLNAGIPIYKRILL